MLGAILLEIIGLITLSMILSGANPYRGSKKDKDANRTPTRNRPAER